ncbi:MMPL family transporter [Amycolatopsis acidicola]|uniref:MMPL family transporter n=1 Tax=Amycolatopsis acidicola TaxID=2596893 RepID=A0A5N0VKW4_9PSEU|nr:MMPL family transporter [Amycolatopsis acidicola]KAA9165984.1 MMPL family transporter [Amycolatopsis acidicola]
MKARARRILSAVRHPTRRGAFAVLAVLAVLVVGGFVAGGAARLRVQTDLDSFLPRDDPELTQFDSVSRVFGADPIVVLVRAHQPGQQLDEAHLLPLLGLEGKLSQLPDVAAVYGPGTTLNQIAGQTQLLLAELTGRRDGIQSQAVDAAKQRGASDSAAQEAGQEALRQFDLRYGPLLVQAMPAGLPTLHNPGFVRSVVYDTQGKPKGQWRFIIPSADSAAVLIRPRQGLDETAAKSLVDSVRSTVADAKLDAAQVQVSGVPVIISALGDEVRGEIPLLGGIAVLALAGCFLLVPWTRWRRRLLPVATTLLAVAMTLAIFGWLDKPVSLGVVAFLPVLLGIGSYYPTYFAQHARWRMVFVVVTASAASFATLTLSPMPFISDLGLAMSVGVLLAAGTGFVLLGRHPREEDSEPGRTAPRARRHTRSTVLAAGLVVGALGWAALPGMPLEGSFEKLAAGLPALSDARDVESVMGSSGELDVVLDGGDALAPQAIAWAQQAQNVAVSRYGDQLRPVVSPPTLLPFLGAAPNADQIQAGVRLLPKYLTGAVFSDDNKTALLSFGVRFDDMGSLQHVRDDLAASLPPPPAGYHVEITGLPAVAVRGNELLSGDRVLMNLAGIVAAGSVLALGLRRRADAGRAVLAAAIATGAGLAGMHLAGVPLSPVTVGLGSLTAAVGCEFTVLLAESARRNSRTLRRSVGLAALTSAVGYTVLSFSGLTAIREFGLLLAGSVLLALAAAACVVWATVGRPGRGTETADIPEVRKPMVGVR